MEIPIQNFQSTVLINNNTPDPPSTIPQSLASLKSLDVKSLYKVGSYCDVLDSYSTWRVGKIMELRGDYAKVNFDGWDHKWDEMIKLGGNKILPFRRATICYTGGSKGAVRDFNFHEKKAYLQTALEQMLGVAHDEFKLGDANLVVQYLRGELYILMDSLLSITVTFRDMNDLKFTADFIEGYIKIFCNYIETLPNVFRDYIDWKALNEPLIYLVNQNVAIASAIPEMFDTMRKIFAGSQRVLLYSSNEFPLKQYHSPPAVKPKDKNGYCYYAAVANLINFFIVHGGMEKLLKVVRWEYQPPDDPSGKTDNEPYRCPLIYLKWIIIMLQPAVPYFSQQFKEKIGNELLNCFHDRLTRLTNRDIKDNDSFQVFHLIRESVTFFEALIGKEAYAFCETLELEIAFTFFRSPFLEKKIKVLSEFTDFVQRASEQKSEPNVDLMAPPEKRKFRYINNLKLKQWIIQKELLDYIIGDRFHVEIFKRAVVIIKFLASEGALADHHIDQLWKYTSDSQEGSVKTVYKTFVELSSEASVENLDYMFSKIKEIPIEKYDDYIINMIRDFSLNAMARVNAPLIKRKTPKYEYYGFSLLYQAILDSSPLKQEYFHTAFNAVVTLGKNPNFKGIRERCMRLCCENVRKGLSVPQSLYIILHILSSYSTSSFLGFDSHMEEAAARLQEDYNIFNSVIKNMSKYLEKVSAEIEKQKEKGITIENKRSYRFEGRYSHEKNIEARLVFLENIGLQLEKVEFGLEHLKKLWNILYKCSVTEVERTEFLCWMTKYREKNGEKRFIIKENLMKSFFASVLSSPEQTDNFKIYTPELFRCFEKYFQYLNEIEGNIVSSKGTERVVKYEKLIGLDVLWKIFLNCPNEKVLKSVTNILVKVHLKIYSPEIRERMAIWQKFMDKSLECIHSCKAAQDHKQISRIISLINSFVMSFDGKEYIRDGREGGSQEPLSFIVVDKNNENSRKTVEIAPNGTIFLLRKKIAEAFGVGNYDFEIYNSGNFRIPPEVEEDNPASAIYTSRDKYRERDLTIELKPVENHTVGMKEKFKNVIANNQEIMDLLFELLGQDNNSIVNEIWQLLSFLPVNHKLTKTLKNLEIEKEEDWFKLLDASCLKKLLYCLQVISEFMTSSGSQSSEEWVCKFVQKKGFSHLFKIVLLIKDSDLTNLFNCKCLAGLLRQINTFIDSYPSLVAVDEEQIIQLLAKALDFLNLVSKPGYVQDAGDRDLQKNLQNPIHDLIFHAFTIIQTALKIKPALVANIYKFPDIELLLRNALIENNEVKFRSEFAEGLVNLASLVSQLSVPSEIQNINSFLLSILVNNLFEAAVSNWEKCKQYFTVLDHIFEASKDSDIDNSSIKFEELIDKLTDSLLKLEPTETQQTEQDYLLQGLLDFLSLLCKFKPNIMEEIVTKKRPEFIKEIVHSFLFEIPSSSNPKAPKCKSPESRRAAFLLVRRLCTSMNKLSELTVQQLRAPLINNFWRTPSISNWNIVPFSLERSSTGYVGLKNLGCICYMNSLMQQFFMIPDFRDTILETEDVNENKIEKQDNLLYQLKMIFASLKLSQRQFYNPKNFCYSYKDYEGNPINVTEQQDVDEFFNNLLDRIENQIKTTKTANIIKRVFGGVLSNELICKGCPHYSEREEPFLAVSLQVKGKKSITESLQHFIHGEMLEGDNAYYCGKCDKKVPTLKRVCIKKLPNILILVLKRFEFNFDTMQKHKVNDYCEFPSELNMEQYTHKYLKKHEEKANPQNSSDNSNEEQQNQHPEVEMPEDEPDYPPEYYEYNLRGVVIHAGTAESGHYYSLIKDPNNNWFEFNDSNVRPFRYEDLAQEAFGGKTELNFGGGNMQGSFHERTNNAYLLFYERKSYFDENGGKVPSMLVGDMTREMLANGPISKKIYDEVREDNFRFQTIKLVFDKDYHDFAYQVTKFCEENCVANRNEYFLECCKYCITYFLTVTIRALDRARIPLILKDIKSLLSKSYDVSLWLIRAFSNYWALKEFLVTCAIKDMKYFVFGLLKIALNTVYTFHKDEACEALDSNALGRFVQSVFYFIYAEKDHARSLENIYKLLAVFSNLGESAQLYLIRKRIITRIYYYLKGEELPESFRSYKEEFYFDELMEKGELGKSSGSNEGENESVDKKKDTKKVEVHFNYNSLVEVVVNIIMGSKRISYNKSNPNREKAKLDPSEHLLVHEKGEMWSTLMQHTTSKRSRKLLSNLIGFLAIRKDQFSQTILNIVEKGLAESDDIELKIYLQVLQALMLINDGHQLIRVHSGIGILQKTIKENSFYHRATEICIGYLFKICAKSEWCLKVACEDSEFIIFVENWIKENTNPQQGSNNQTLKLFKKKASHLNSQALQNGHMSLYSRAQERLSKIRKIAKKDQSDLGYKYDSDDDFTDHKYKIGEKIDFLSESGWVTAVVLESLDEMIYIQLIGNQTVWVHYDSEKLAPYMTMQLRQKREMDFYVKN